MAVPVQERPHSGQDDRHGEDEDGSGSADRSGDRGAAAVGTGSVTGPGSADPAPTGDAGAPPSRRPAAAGSAARLLVRLAERRNRRRERRAEARLTQAAHASCRGGTCRRSGAAERDRCPWGHRFDTQVMAAAFMAARNRPY